MPVKLKWKKEYLRLEANLFLPYLLFFNQVWHVELLAKIYNASLPPSLLVREDWGFSASCRTHHGAQTGHTAPPPSHTPPRREQVISTAFFAPADSAISSPFFSFFNLGGYYPDHYGRLTVVSQSSQGKTWPYTTTYIYTYIHMDINIKFLPHGKPPFFLHFLLLYALFPLPFFSLWWGRWMIKMKLKPLPSWGGGWSAEASEGSDQGTESGNNVFLGGAIHIE